jgi:hypothetical protein
MFSKLAKNKEYKSIMDLPGIEGDETIAFAMLIQNALSPKNSQRVESIKNNDYV